MTTRALNFLWLNLDLPAPPDLENGSIRAPMPTKYIENLRQAGAKNKDMQVALWVDSQRLTKKQLAYLSSQLAPQVLLKDLRSLPAYCNEELYNQPDKNPEWRNGSQTSIIWRQVDAAKILISLQGDFDQVFFSDLDRAHVDFLAPEIQDRIEKHGLFIGGRGIGVPSVENQLWGFTQERRTFFERYYAAALHDAKWGENAYLALVNQAHHELRGKEGLQIEDFCLIISGDGTEACHPDHKHRTGYSAETSLQSAFNQLGEKILHAAGRLYAFAQNKLKI